MVDQVPNVIMPRNKRKPARLIEDEPVGDSGKTKTRGRPKKGQEPPLPKVTGQEDVDEGSEDGRDQELTDMKHSIGELTTRATKVEGLLNAILGKMEAASSSPSSSQPSTSSKEVGQESRSPGHFRSPRRRFRSRSRSARSPSSSCDSRSPSRHHKRESKKGEFDQSNYLDRNQKVDSIETLLLVNVRLIKQLHEAGEEITAVIDHVELLVEKSSTRIFTLNALVAYDRSVKDRADRKGLRAFGSVENSDILRYLGYDGTVNAQKQSTKNNSIGGKSSIVKNANSPNVCFAFNRAEGCKMNPCRYRHVCSGCGIQGHAAEACRKAEVKK